MLETMLNGYPVEVGDLDAEWVLDLAAEAEVRERQAGRTKLRAAARWCVLHPATVETGFVTWSDTGLPGLCPEDEALGGEGTPLVAAFSLCPFRARSAGRVRAVAGVADPSQSALLRCAPPVRFQRVSSVRFACPQDRPGHPQPVHDRRRVC